MEKDESIFIAGHRGLVGSAILRKLSAVDRTRLLTRTRAELELTNCGAVEKFFDRERPAIAVIAAAEIGGIKANNEQPVEFLTENLLIQNNLICAAHASGVRNCFSSAAPVSIRNTRRSQFRKAHCSADRLSRRTRRMPLPRSPGSALPGV